MMNVRTIHRSAAAFRLRAVYLLLVVFLLAIYVVWLHAWMTAWGATEAERSAALPGDELVPDADIQVTRAITIDASAAEVWAWVIQMGQDRAGFYSYTWIENLLGADIHNADRVHPEWQHPHVGQIVFMARPDYFGGRLDFTRAPIVTIAPEQAFISRGWGALVLRPVGANRTRLIVRDRYGSARDPLPSRLALRAFGWLFWDPGHFVMQRQMLRGLRARAEGHPSPEALLRIAARVGWTVAGLGALRLFLVRRHRWPWLMIPLAVVVPVLLTTGDVDAALAGFLAVGITVLGVLAFGRRWWLPYTVVAAGVLLVLLLAPDAYVAFGLLFDFALLLALPIGLRPVRRRLRFIRPLDFRGSMKERRDPL